MKLLIYVHSLENGGAERVVVNLAGYWAARGWEVTVVTVAPQSSDFYVLDPAVHRICLNLAGRSGGVASGLLRTVKRVRALRCALDAVRPDVALSAMHTANVVLSMATQGMPQLVRFGSEHNFPPMAPMGPIWETLRRFAYARLDMVVALTPECAGWIGANTLARNIQVIPNPVCWPLPVQEPLLQPDCCCRAGRRVLLAAGRLSEEKNFSTLISVFSRLAHSHADWDLVILGDGPLRAELCSQVEAGALTRRVFLPGRVGNMADWYARAELYGMSSLFEGFPNTLAEAMAHGVPAVSFDCDTGPRDIIRHGIDGLLVPPGDEVALEAALGLLMADEALRHEYAALATEARQRFSIDSVAAMWETLFLRARGHPLRAAACKSIPSRSNSSRPDA